MKAYNVEIEDIDTSDYPDFCDAFVSYAEHEDGTPFTAEELDDLHDNHRDVVHKLVWDYIH